MNYNIFNYLFCIWLYTFGFIEYETIKVTKQNEI